METAVVIIPKLNENMDIIKIRKWIHEYVGQRMVKEEPDDMPGLVLNGVLEEKDKETIGKQYENCAFFFLEHDEEGDDIPNGNYLTIEM